MRRLVVGWLGFRSCRERSGRRHVMRLVTRLGALIFLAAVSEQARALRCLLPCAVQRRDANIPKET